MSCRQICTQYQFDEDHRNWGKYEKGIKRCSCCKKYLEYFEQKCPCCKGTLKSEAKKIKHKNQIHQNFIYKKFRLKLNLEKEVIDTAKKWEADLMKKVAFEISPTIMASACIYIGTLYEQDIAPKEILDVFKIPESELRDCLEKISESLTYPLK